MSTTLTRRDLLAGLAGATASGLAPRALAQPTALEKAARAEGRTIPDVIRQLKSRIG